MAKNHSGLVPFSSQPGRIEDFLHGMEDSKDNKAISFLGGAIIGYNAASAWSHFRGYLKDKK